MEVVDLLLFALHERHKALHEAIAGLGYLTQHLGDFLRQRGAGRLLRAVFVEVHVRSTVSSSSSRYSFSAAS